GRASRRDFGVRERRAFELFDKWRLYLFSVEKARRSLSVRRILARKKYFMEFLPSADLDFRNDGNGWNGRDDFFSGARERARASRDFRGGAADSDFGSLFAEYRDAGAFAEVDGI
ncbi:MAG: hypothetical protein IJO40_01080, partial [Thermoguttaceae bacterium]|nr:hypothetical protein [Thermoguttaceae bacterium]